MDATIIFLEQRDIRINSLVGLQNTDTTGGEDLVPVAKMMGTEGPRQGDAMRGYDAIHGNIDDERSTTIRLGNYAVVIEEPVLHDMAFLYN